MPVQVLPPGIFPSRASPELIDFGFWQQPGAGGEMLRIERPGSRWKCDFTLPPLKIDTAKVVLKRLIQARSDKIRIPFSLMGSNQNYVGTPVVDAAGPYLSGKRLSVRGMSPGFTVQEGWWFCVGDTEGMHHLHMIAENTGFDATGRENIYITPALRRPLPDGSVLHMAQPFIEGFVTSEAQWDLPESRMVRLSFTVTEAR